MRRKAIAYFREHYEPTLLCFVPPQTLILDDTGQNLPLVLMLSILALASKFVLPLDFIAIGWSNIYIDSSQNSHFLAETHQKLAMALRTQHAESWTAITINPILQRSKHVLFFVSTKLDMDLKIKGGFASVMPSAWRR